MRVKPIDIVDDFMGDRYLGCPVCKEAVHFPLSRKIIYPKTCIKCGAEFDWSQEGGEKKDGE